MNPSYIRYLLSHYQSIWKTEGRVCLFDKGPAHQLPVHFVVAEFPPTADRGMWKYATCGMSDETNPALIELHLFSATQSEQHVELLTAVTHYHHTEKHLGLWDTINFGRPWLPGSNCDHGLISLPYLDGPALEKPEGSAVRCLWLIPITKAEVDYKKTHGVEELETRLEEARFDYLAATRPSVA
ncbi:suppressor of fused domain protein [Haliangium sp. UPWRP_2]|uniref:suppressor of fused domain protein n=1 Tax=Haliangium sp. UPWRP_2 TaxID=1931276 RepID=UPI000B53DF8F|nr:suppressor of fused domain protein [Haliangium sp. UPWRP_2]PSM31880.1 hypothetical protein BVG81_003205 [Haliangium sp. UPWRP_2]